MLTAHRQRCHVSCSIRLTRCIMANITLPILPSASSSSVFATALSSSPSSTVFLQPNFILTHTLHHSITSTLLLPTPLLVAVSSATVGTYTSTPHRSSNLLSASASSSRVHTNVSRNNVGMGQQPNDWPGRWRMKG